MRKNRKIWILAGGLLVVMIILNMKSWAGILKTFLPAWEGYRSTPKWDFKQWSWGYGTRVPGSVNNPAINPGGTISRTQAMIQALQHVNADYQYLQPLIQIPLKNSQWAALLSFSYNEGPGSADNLISDINNQDPGLEKHWKSYKYAGGQVSTDLINRRAAEWNLFIS